MGLPYYITQCGGTLETAQLASETWCLSTPGSTCCAVCASMVSSVGTRVGATTLVGFATLLVIYDADLGSFYLEASLLQALAYLLTLFIAGAQGNKISRFHAYYALFVSLGFLAPLAAISVSPNGHLYGRLHPKTQNTKIQNVNIGRPGSYGLPAWVQPPKRRPKRSDLSRVEHDHSSSSENERLDVERSRESPRVEEPDSSRTFSLAVSSRPNTLRKKRPTSGSANPTTSSTREDYSRKPRKLRTKRKQLPIKSQPSPEVKAAQLKADLVTYKATRLRTWFTIGGTAFTLAVWIVAFLYLSNALSWKFEFSQADCVDPSGTGMMYRSIVTFLVLGLVVLIGLYANYHWVGAGIWLDWPFHFNASRFRKKRAIAPAIFGLSTFTLWSSLLWISYREASAPMSSLLSANEEKSTFTSILACVLALRGAADLPRAWNKHRARIEVEEVEKEKVALEERERIRMDQQEQMR